MNKFPDDILYYFRTTDGEPHYFSVVYKPSTRETMIAEIESDEFWALVVDGQLVCEDISPADFKYSLPATIQGDVKVFKI